MTVHRDKFLVNKTNRRTDFQIYCFYDSTCFGQTFHPSSGVLSRISGLVHFMKFDARLLPTPGSNPSSNLHKMYQCRCTAKNSWWWAEWLPETCRFVVLYQQIWNSVHLLVLFTRNACTCLPEGEHLVFRNISKTFDVFSTVHHRIELFH